MTKKVDKIYEPFLIVVFADLMKPQTNGVSCMRRSHSWLPTLLKCARMHVCIIPLNLLSMVLCS